MQQLKSLHTEVKENLTLIDSLQKKEQYRLDRIDEETARLENQIQESQNTLATVRSIIETSEPQDLVTQHSELQRNVKVVADSKTEIEIDLPATGMSKVEYTEALTITGAFSSMMQVKKIQCELLNEFGDFQIAWFVTATSSGLLVISDYDAKQVHIYSQQKNGQYKKQSSLTLSSKNTTKNPYGVAVMADGKYLVARWTHAEVYSPSGIYEGALDAKYDDKMCAREKGINNVKIMPDGRVLLGEL